MKLKLDENGNVVVQDGKAVYVHDDGQESAYDALHSYNTIKRLTKEAEDNRKSAKEVSDKLALFGDLDPTTAKDALAKLKNFDDKKLVDAGEIEKLKAELAESYKNAYEPQIAEWKNKYEGFVSNFQNKDLETKFLQSEYIKQNIIAHPSVMFKTFKENFSYDESGSLIALDQNGQKIYSRNDPSKPADFDEAFSLIVGACPFKDTLIKGNQSQGGGYNGGNGNTGGVKKSLADCKTKEEKIEFLKTVE